MSRTYPERVRPEKVAAAKRTFSGTVPVKALTRLDDLLAESREDQALSFEVSFDLDDEGQTVADVFVTGALPLICQRTMEPFDFAIESRSKICIVQDEAMAEQLPEDYEPLVCPTGELALQDLVEEEALLALPLVPTAPGAVIPESLDVVVVEEPEPPTHRPFEVLGELKKTNQNKK